MHYVVKRSSRGWIVETNNRDTPTTRIGRFDTRREAEMMARLLAGWRGTVTTVRR